MDTPNNESNNERPPNPYSNPLSAPRYPESYAGTNNGNPYSAGQEYQNPYVAPPQNSYSSSTPYVTNQYVQPLNNPYAGQTNNSARNEQATYNPNVQQRVLMGQRFETQPRWTMIFLVIIGICFAGQVVTGGLNDRSYDLLVRYGAALEYNIRQGELWRLVTPIFIHFGILHIAFNALALWSFGMQAEKIFGTSRFIVLFFLTGIAGNVLPIFLENNAIPAAGASGSLFGLLGALIGFFYRNRAEMGNWARENLRGLLITAVLNFVITLSIPNVGHFAHLGGLLAGVFLGYFLSPLHIKRTIGKGAQAANVRTGDFISEWWSVGAMVAILGVLLFLTFQAPMPVANPFIPGRG